jgi:hypothetical protein
LSLGAEIATFFAPPARCARYNLVASVSARAFEHEIDPEGAPRDDGGVSVGEHFESIAISDQLIVIYRD